MNLSGILPSNVWGSEQFRGDFRDILNEVRVQIGNGILFHVYEATNNHKTFFFSVDKSMDFGIIRLYCR